LLDERCRQRGLFEPSTVQTVVENHLSGRRNHTFLIMALMIFELGQRELVDETSESPSGLLPVSPIIHSV
jgi:hypothetical protein